MATRNTSTDALSKIEFIQSKSLFAKDLRCRSSKLADDFLQLLENVDTSFSTVPVEEMDLNLASIARLKKFVAARAVRNRLFPTDLFADPAWDILLDLAIAMAEGRCISVSSLCIAANVPTTTALRQIKSMVEKGLLVIAADPKDGRRKQATLSDGVFEMMTRFAISTM